MISFFLIINSFHKEAILIPRTNHENYGQKYQGLIFGNKNSKSRRKKPTSRRKIPKSIKAQPCLVLEPRTREQADSSYIQMAAEGWRGIFWDIKYVYARL